MRTIALALTLIFFAGVAQAAERSGPVKVRPTKAQRTTTWVATGALVLGSLLAAYTGPHDHAIHGQITSEHSVVDQRTVAAKPDDGKVRLYGLRITSTSHKTKLWPFAAEVHVQELSQLPAKVSARLPADAGTALYAKMAKDVANVGDAFSMPRGVVRAMNHELAQNGIVHVNGWGDQVSVKAVIEPPSLTLPLSNAAASAR